MLGAIIVGVHIGKIVEIHFFKFVAYSCALLYAGFVQRVVWTVLVAGAFGVAENERYLFGGAEATQDIVD